MAKGHFVNELTIGDVKLAVLVAVSAIEYLVMDCHRGNHYVQLPNSYVVRR